MSQRTDRVDELLRQEIGVLLAKEIADPRIGFVTITDVETAPDLRHAKVWVSVIGGKADQKETLRALQHSMGFIRHELGRTLRIKRIPDLHVHLDDSMERGTRVLHLLQELDEGKDPDTIEPYQESLPKPVARVHHEGDAEDPMAGLGEAAAAADLPPIPSSPAPAGRRPTTRRGPGGPRAGRGAHPRTPQRQPKKHK
ncbi:MAG TPA: 30S ribosome-binding factor RbfA [Candidatus Limnocylindrales bacterium]|jgi:ribosome-binding factor A|nr:30S ribosome-binding factor RbfA [Candidatus Limnocylindrales bacterium]